MIGAVHQKYLIFLLILYFQNINTNIEKNRYENSCGLIFAEPALESAAREVTKKTKL